MSSKMEDITSFVNGNISSLRESVEMIKREISGQDEIIFS